jgi:hypothetical protein
MLLERHVLASTSKVFWPHPQSHITLSTNGISTYSARLWPNNVHANMYLWSHCCYEEMHSIACRHMYTAHGTTRLHWSPWDVSHALIFFNTTVMIRTCIIHDCLTLSWKSTTAPLAISTPATSVRPFSLATINAEKPSSYMYTHKRSVSYLVSMRDNLATHHHIKSTCMYTAWIQYAPVGTYISHSCSYC